MQDCTEHSKTDTEFFSATLTTVPWSYFSKVWTLGAELNLQNPESYLGFSVGMKMDIFFVNPIQIGDYPIFYYFC